MSKAVQGEGLVGSSCAQAWSWKVDRVGGTIWIVREGMDVSETGFDVSSPVDLKSHSTSKTVSGCFFGQHTSLLPLESSELLNKKLLVKAAIWAHQTHIRLQLCQQLCNSAVHTAREYWHLAVCPSLPVNENQKLKMLLTMDMLQVGNLTYGPTVDKVDHPVCSQCRRNPW